jgi:hypothetical protein
LAGTLQAIWLPHEERRAEQPKMNKIQMAVAKDK